ncbi:MAG: hypothetical protein ACREX7_03765 [Casimicrobiaceae bacterium]
MPVECKSPAASRRSHDPAFDFLEAYDNRTWSNDDGALLGQLEMMREGWMVPVLYDEPLWQQAVSRAVSST